MSDEILKIVLQKVENTADFLVIHDYFKRKPNPNNVTYDEYENITTYKSDIVCTIAMYIYVCCK